MAAMSISVLAAQGGVGVETVRYYQRRGLLPAPPPSATGDARRGMYRYGDADVRRLRFIRAAQAAGFTLDEIGHLLVLDPTRDRKRVHALASGRIAALDAKIDALLRARGALARLAHDCAVSKEGPCPIMDAFDPAEPAEADPIAIQPMQSV